MRRFFPDLSSDDYGRLLPLLQGSPALQPLSAREALAMPAARELAIAELGASHEEKNFEAVIQAWGDAFVEQFFGEADLTHKLHLSVRRRCEETLALYVTRSLVQEMNRWGPSDVSGEARYKQFCVAVAANPLSFFNAYPVMRDRLRVALANQLDGLRSLFRRWSSDADEVSAKLGLGTCRTVTGVRSSGDTHNGGQSVSIITLEDGSKVVYKPRSTEAELDFYQFCNALRPITGYAPDAPAVVLRPGYGWVQHLEDDGGAVEPRALGRLLAVMYLLNSRDMHFENVFNMDGNPTPIDLETIMHPHRVRVDYEMASTSDLHARLDMSVYGTGLLPVLLGRPGRDGYIDVGAAHGGQAVGDSPFKEYYLSKAFHADARVVLGTPPRRGTDPAERDDASAQGERVDPRTFAREVTGGFAEAYTAIEENRDTVHAFLETHFTTTQLRYIHNPTTQYVGILRMLTGPDASSQTDVTSGLVSRIAIPSRECDPRLVHSEIRQLLAGDVPYFTAVANEVKIRDDQGRHVADLAETPLSRALVTLQAMGEEDLHEQLRFIHIALGAKIPEDHAEPTRTASTASRLSVTDLVRQTADWLVARVGADRFDHLPKTWIGPVVSADDAKPWPPGVAGYDLYAGRTGTALALAAAARATADGTYERAARDVFDPLAAIIVDPEIDLNNATEQGPGIYTGLPSTLWALSMAGKLLDEDDYATAAVAGTHLFPEGWTTGEPDDTYWDLLSGGIGSSLNLTQSSRHLTVDEVSDALSSRQHDPGLAHGNTGIIHALTRRTASGTCPETVLPLLHDRLTAAVTDNPDSQGSAVVPVSWCNGLSGMVVATMTLGCDDLTELLVLRLQQAVRNGNLGSYTLCHGALGAYEVLRLVSSDPRAHDVREELARSLPPWRLLQGLNDTTRRYNHSPALMAGRAGILWHAATRTGAVPHDLSPLIP